MVELVISNLVPNFEKKKIVENELCKLLSLKILNRLTLITGVPK